MIHVKQLVVVNVQSGSRVIAIATQLGRITHKQSVE